MKYAAIDFLQKDLSDDSHCYIFVGNNRWLRKQIREKIEENFGLPISMSAQEEDSLLSVADMVCTPSLDPRVKRFIQLTDLSTEKAYQWLEYIEFTPKNVVLLISFEEKKEDKRTYPTQIKNLFKYEKSDKISYIDVRDPSDEISKEIIKQILKSYRVSADKFKFFERYGTDFDSIEENAKKIRENKEFDYAVLDKKETTVKDIWLLADLWIEGNLARCLEIISEIEKSDLKSYAVQNMLTRQFRNHIIAAETGKGHPYVVSRSRAKPASWLVGSYRQIAKINPVYSSYFDVLRKTLIATFTRRFDSEGTE